MTTATTYRFKPGEWVRLPAKLKRRWWRETEYGTLEPSDELKEEIEQWRTVKPES